MKEPNVSHVYLLPIEIDGVVVISRIHDLACPDSPSRRNVTARKRNQTHTHKVQLEQTLMETDEPDRHARDYIFLRSTAKHTCRCIC